MMMQKVKCSVCGREYDVDVFMDDGHMNMKCPFGCSFVAIIEKGKIIRVKGLFE
jgi:hypothetical protein